MTSARGKVIGPSDKPGPPRVRGARRLASQPAAMRDVSEYEPLYVGHRWLAGWKTVASERKEKEKENDG